MKFLYFLELFMFPIVTILLQYCLIGNISEMFSIKFTVPFIISVIVFPKFLACASLTNYGKKLEKFPRIL